MHSARDAVVLELRSYFVAIGRPNHVEVPDGMCTRRHRRSLDELRQELRVGSSVRSPELVPPVQMSKLHAQHGGLERVEPLVATDRDVLVLSPLTEIAEHAGLVGQRGVARDDRAGVAVCAEILPRIETESGDFAERTATPVLVFGAVSLRRILEEGQATL